MLEIELNTPEDFLKVKETLTRVGIASLKNKTLYQSTHILHKRGRYFLVHFKELLALDGKETDISDTDIKRRNCIAHLLSSWGLIRIVRPNDYPDDTGFYGHLLRIIPYAEKGSWKLVPKYNIGKKR